MGFDITTGGKMKILLYKGTSQYGAFDHFGESLKKAFEARNHTVDIFDLTVHNAMQTIIQVFSTKAYDIVIGFNGIGSDIKVGNDSIYNIIKTHFLGIFVDHPAYHISRLASPMNYYLASFLDKSHVDFLQNTMPQSQVLKFFMPLSGNEYGKNIDSYDDYTTIKDIDILFTGSNFGSPIKEWENLVGFPTYLFDEISYEMIHNEYITVEEAFTQIFDKYKIAFSSISKAQVAVLISMVIGYVRQYKRSFILDKLFQAGLPITVYGKNWENMSKQHPNVTNGGEVSLEKTIELTKRAKIVINLNTNFTQGAHDRVFTGMLNHAVVFTDKSTYYDEFYTDKVNYLTYSLNTLEKDIDKLKKFILDDKKLFEMANSAYSITSQSQTWTLRAKYLEEMVILAKSINSIG